MARLTTTDKELILKNGGILIDGELTVRFDKVSKPSKRCKKRLRELGYEISDISGARYYPYMDFRLKPAV